jgi:hypothetical protein
MVDWELPADRSGLVQADLVNEIFEELQVQIKEMKKQLAEVLRNSAEMQIVEL